MAALEQLDEAGGGGEGLLLALPDDGGGDAAGEPLLAVLAQDPLELGGVVGVEDLGRGDAGALVHPHVQRRVVAVGEAPLGLVQLQRGDPEVEEHGVDRVQAQVVEDRGQLVVHRVHPGEAVAVRRPAAPPPARAPRCRGRCRRPARPGRPPARPRCGRPCPGCRRGTPHPAAAAPATAAPGCGRAGRGRAGPRRSRVCSWVGVLQVVLVCGRVVVLAGGGAWRGRGWSLSSGLQPLGRCGPAPGKVRRDAERVETWPQGPGGRAGWSSRVTGDPGSPPRPARRTPARWSRGRRSTRSCPRPRPASPHRSRCSRGTGRRSRADRPGW